MLNMAPSPPLNCYCFLFCWINVYLYSRAAKLKISVVKVNTRKKCRVPVPVRNFSQYGCINSSFRHRHMEPETRSGNETSQREGEECLTTATKEKQEGERRKLSGRIFHALKCKLKNNQGSITNNFRKKMRVFKFPFLTCKTFYFKGIRLLFAWYIQS